MAAPSVVTEYRGTSGALYEIVAYRKVTPAEAAVAVRQAIRAKALRPVRNKVFQVWTLIGLNE